MSFNVMVASQPSGLAKGQFKCEITPQGLTLSKRGQNDIEIPVGTKAERAEGNHVRFELPAGTLVVRVTRFGSYQDRLAADIAEFISGNRDAPQLQDYAIPWYFYIVCVLPLGIPILTLGGAIPTGGAFVLAGVCLGIVQKEHWPAAVRIAAALGVSLVAYGVVVVLLLIAATQPRA